VRISNSLVTEDWCGYSAFCNVCGRESLIFQSICAPQEACASQLDDTIASRPRFRAHLFKVDPQLVGIQLHKHKCLAAQCTKTNIRHWELTCTLSHLVGGLRFRSVFEAAGYLVRCRWYFLTRKCAAAVEDLSSSGGISNDSHELNYLFRCVGWDYMVG
jgi:hypothetical protein